MKLRDLIFEQDNEVQAAAKAINDAIISIDDSMHYEVFAKAVGLVLKDEYGSHNIKPFMEVLHKELGMNELSEGSDLENSIKKDFENYLSAYKPFVSIGTYHKSDKQFGKVTFRHKGSLPEEDWKKAEQIIEKHGGEITNSGNYYDQEPGERDYYPDIKFDIVK